MKSHRYIYIKIKVVFYINMRGLFLMSQLFYVLDIKIQMQRKQGLIIHLVQDLKHLKLIA